MSSLNAHIAKFEKYAQDRLARCRKDPLPLELKREHTLQVFQNASKIAKGENLSPMLERACQLAALYHDIARFDQYLRFDTFRDAISFNHGLEGVRIIRKENFLADEPMEKSVLVAIACHNKAALPARLNSETLLITNILRNSDKLDILRVLASHLEEKPYNPTVVLGLPDDDNICGEKVREAISAERIPLYEDLRSVNDFRLLLGLWFYDLQFESSRRLYLEAGHGHKIISALPDNELYGGIRLKLIQAFEAEARRMDVNRI